MQLINHKRMMRILVAVLIPVLAIGCLTACSNGSNNSTNGNNNDSGNSQPTVPTSNTSPHSYTHYDWHGLHYSLPNSFSGEQVDNGEYASHTSGSLTLKIEDTATPEGVTDSRSFATHYASEMNAYYTVSTATKDGVYYTIVNYANGTHEARGFYVDEDRCWVMYIATPDFAKNVSTIVSIVTSGTIE